MTRGISRSGRRAARPTATRVQAPRPPAALTFAVGTTAFDELGIGVTVWWNEIARAIHIPPETVVPFEIERKVQRSRWEYNGRSIARCFATRRPVRGTYAGFHDLFVPLTVDGKVEAALMAGPFAVEYPTSDEIARRWSEIGHRRAHLSDPTFVRYLSASLSVLTLGRPLVDAFEKLLVCFGEILNDAPDSARLAEQCETLSHELSVARASERMWETARSMVDDRTSRKWSGAVMRDPLLRMGLKGLPRHVLVGLLRGRDREADPIDEVLRRHAFQRKLTELARQRQNTVCGQVGTHGVALLVCDAGNRSRAALGRLAGETTELARSFGFRLHVGVALGRVRSALPEVYRAALAAAERGLSRGESLSFSEGREPSSRGALATLRASLADSVSAGSVVRARFESYLEAVLVHSGHTFDATRAHLEAGLDRLAEPLLASGQLEPRRFQELTTQVDRGPGAPDSLTDLVASYRTVVSEIAGAVEQPTRARQEGGVQRGVAFMREHLNEPLTLADVARVAGFAPKYFSRLLEREEGQSFEPLLQELRLERAKQLLTKTRQNVASVARASGFKSRTYFQHLFREKAGVTPRQHRRATDANAL